MSELHDPNVTGRVRDVLAQGMLKAFKAQPYASLKPTIDELKSGKIDEFNRRSMKERQFALLAILIESWWANEVTAFRKENSAVQGLALNRRPLDASDFEMLQDSSRPLLKRRQVASECMLKALELTAERFVARMLKAEEEISLDARGAFRMYRGLLNQEIPGTGDDPMVVVRILKSGWENAVRAIWMLPEAICKQVASGVALSHGGAFGFFRAAINKLGAQGEDFTADQLAHDMRKATKVRELQDNSLELLRQTKELNNSSYHPQTVGCPAFYTSAFNGLVEWVAELKKIIK